MNDRQIFLENLAQTSDLPLMLEVEKAEGCYIHDKKGTAYLDLIAGISVSQMGHRHPQVIKAIKQQLDKYLHVMVYGEFVQSPQTRFAQKLMSHLPAGLESVYFVNSGSEAAEGAMKLAKRFTGRHKVVCFDKAYHGSTHGALSLAGDEEMRNSFRPLLPGIQRLDYNSIDHLDEINDDVACVFIETIQGEAGARVPDPEFLKALRKKCDEHNVLLVLDEIQAGFGRTGKLFAFEHFDLEPDILLLGKAMGGGLPIGAFISSKKIMGSLKTDPVLGHISTFGGHPIPCTAGLASFETLLDSGLIVAVDKKEKLIRELLEDHPKIHAIHGKGLMLAVELGDFDRVNHMIKALFEKLVISDWFVFNNKCIRVAPPLTITEAEIIKFCNKIIDVLEDF